MRYFMVVCLAVVLSDGVVFSKTLPPKNSENMTYKGCATSACHTNIDAIRYKHNPIKAEGCNLCHTPILNTHKFKLFSNLQKMCTDCHEDKTKKNFGRAGGQWTLRTENHVFATHPLESLLTAETVNQFKKTGLKLYNGKIECLTCHNPHGTNQPHLLREVPGKGDRVALCVTCHEQKFTSTMHPMKKDDCFECHGFHRAKLGSSLIKFEKKGNDFVCMDCHQEKKALTKTKHDYFTWKEAYQQHAQHTFELPKKIFMRCQSCHSVHTSHGMGSLLVSKIKKDKADMPLVDGLCLSCHRNPKAEGMPQIPMHFQHVPLVLSSVEIPKTGEEFYPTFLTHQGKRAQTSSDLFYLSCATCHDPHSATPKGSKEGVGHKFLVSSKKMMVFCASCHGPKAHELYSQFHKRSAAQKSP